MKQCLKYALSAISTLFIYGHMLAQSMFSGVATIFRDQHTVNDNLKMKTNKLYIVAIAILIAIMVSCGILSPYEYGWRYESGAVNVTSNEFGLDNELLFYGDSIYQRGDAYNMISGKIDKEYIDNNGKVDTIEKTIYFITLNSYNFYSSDKSYCVGILFTIGNDEPFEVGQKYYLQYNTAEDWDWRKGTICVDINHREPYERLMDRPHISDGWICLQSVNRNGNERHAIVDLEFEITLTDSQNPDNKIYLTNGRVQGAWFQKGNHSDMCINY